MCSHSAELHIAGPDSAGGSGARATRGAWPQYRLGPATPLRGIRSIPDQGLRGEVEVARPGHGPVARSGSTEKRVVGAEGFEYRAPQQVLDIALDDRAVRQGETETSSIERRDGADAEHDKPMLAQRFDPLQGLAGLCKVPIEKQLVRVC